MQNLADTQEERRLQEARERQVPWLKWGPYLSERQWGTVREDYRGGGPHFSLAPARRMIHSDKLS